MRRAVLPSPGMVEGAGDLRRLMERAFSYLQTNKGIGGQHPGASDLRSFVETCKAAVSPLVLEPAVGADFANGVYTLNGETAALSDLFLETSTFLYTDIIPGTGLRAEKLVGDAVGAAKSLLFTPEVIALLNQSGGFTAIADYTFDNILDVNGAHHAQSVSIDQYDPLFAHVMREVWAQRHGMGADHGQTTDFLNEMLAYDYDIPEYFDEDNREVGVIGDTTGKLGIAMGDVFKSYFQGEVPLEQNIASPYPHPDASVMHFNISAKVHEGAPADKLLVTCRTTVPRLHIYTPQMPAGWVPRG